MNSITISSSPKHQTSAEILAKKKKTYKKPGYQSGGTL